MKNSPPLFQTALRSSLAAASFAVTLAGLAYAYAALSPLPNVQTNDPLSASAWNAMVSNVNSLASSGGVPAGGVMAFFGTSCPTGWSAADGTANGVKKTDGSTWTLDLRGQFIRGLNTFDNGVTTRTDGKQDTESRSLGAWQSDVFQGHKHSLAGLKNAVLWGGSTHWNNAPWYSDTWSSSLIGGPIDDGINWTPRTWLETRPRNVALLYCVKN